MAKASARERPEEAPIPKTKAHTTATGTGRGRKPANGKEPAVQHNSNDTLTAQTNGQPNGAVAPVISPWSTAPLEVLHSYRSFHRLKIPASYRNPHAHHILAHGIGRQSPTAAAVRKDKRRVHREGLAMAVRKHFNASAVNENDAVVNTLYKARTNEKSLRLKFLPNSKQR